jgi:hypothetical protein
MPRFSWLLWAGSLVSLGAAPGFATNQAVRPAESASRVPISRKPKPRGLIAVGDHWRVRVSDYPMQMPDPEWSPPETWLFDATVVEKTKEGPRLVVTATREGSVKPGVRLYLEPDTGALTRVETMLPVPGGERAMVERPTPGQPFVSEMSPVLIAFASPGKPHEEPADPQADHQPMATGAGQPAFAFDFGQRFSQQTEPVDAGVGRAKIERGMSALKLSRRARMEPDGVPRFVTDIAGPGRHVEQVWDETTPWPLYSETDSSRCWLVAYTKGKSS